MFWAVEGVWHLQKLMRYWMEGRRVGSAHGAPARLQSPIKIGDKTTKDLTKVGWLPKRNGGYWSDQGYEWYGGT